MSFGSPACDYVENSLDLNRFLISHPIATYFMKMQGDAHKNAGIFNGDILVVDRSLPAADRRLIGRRTQRRTYRPTFSLTRRQHLSARRGRPHPALPSQP